MLNQKLIEERAGMLLHTEGNRLVNVSGEEVRLIGVNCSGLETSTHGDRIKERAAIAFDDWRANVVRFPASQNSWFGYAPGQEEEGDRSGEAYRARFDELADMAAERGKYIIFELHWSNGGSWEGKPRQYRMPDALSVEFWRDAALRYANHPAVIFGAYNEPFRIPWDIWQSGGWVEENEEVRYAASGMQAIINTIRAAGAKNVLIIGALDWAFDLRKAEEYPLDNRGGKGIIYDSHVYPWKPADYDTYIPPSLAARFPIIIAECGHYSDDHDAKEGKQRSSAAEWGPELLKYIEERGFHLAAWCFHPKAGPCLIKDYEGTPTDYWGIYVKEFCGRMNGGK